MYQFYLLLYVHNDILCLKIGKIGKQTFLFTSTILSIIHLKEKCVICMSNVDNS